MLPSHYNFKKFLPTAHANYSVNSDGYRTLEFDAVDWPNSIVMFGCSMVFGEALDEKHTIAYQLSKLLNCPVINMGVIGSSIQHSVHNQIILKQNYPTPRAVVNIWTEYSRCTLYSDNILNTFGPWNTEKGSYGDIWNANTVNAQVNALLMQAVSRQLWHTTKHYEATFFRSTQGVLDCEQLNGHLTKTDYATDGQHPGPLATRAVSELLAEALA
jgi:hypothetical protein